MAGALVGCVLFACGSGAASGEGAGDGDESGDEVAEAVPEETLAPATTSEGVLQRLARAMPLDTSEWDAETNRLVEPGGADPLVGTSRDAVVARLGEPNAADFNREGQAGWTIGRIENPRMGHPPILVVELDASGVITRARFQLSM